MDVVLVRKLLDQLPPLLVSQADEQVGVPVRDVVRRECLPASLMLPAG